MLKRRLTINDYLLIVINLIPLYGVWFLGWDAKHIFVVYAMETVIIGIINVLKMSFITLFVKKQDTWQNNGGSSMQSGWFFILFFIAHYGFFVFVQTQLFFNTSRYYSDGSFLFNYAKIPTILGDDGKLVLLIFILYYSLQSFFTFFGNGIYKTISMGRLMFEPYMRIFTQQVIVILGSMFLTFGAGKIFILIFVVAKIFFELFINYNRLLSISEKRERQKNKLPQ
ncbi:MAG: hypothetical protein KA319_01900 [Ferruginibacter sp.]|nr:hypothetical protein [Ferruginibacter sp.]